MATKNIVPRADGEGELGTSSKKWSKVNVQQITASVGVSASFFYGDGSNLTGITGSGGATPTLQEVTTVGNTTTDAITASAFVGDGSGITGVTAEWDGTHFGDAEITGTLTTRAVTNLEFQSATGYVHGSISNNGFGTLTLDGPTTGSLNVGSGVSNVVMNASNSVTMQVLNGLGFMYMNPYWAELRTPVLYVSGTNPSVDNVGLQYRPTTFNTHNRYTAMGYDNTYSGSVLTAGAAGVGGDNKLIFQVSNDTFSEFPCAAFDHSGNLGINTLTPTHKLQVVGDISGSTFYGDGSGLTGITAEWDGSRNGDASITGSLTMTQGGTTFYKGTDGTTSGSIFPNVSFNAHGVNSTNGLQIGGQTADLIMLSILQKAIISNLTSQITLDGTNIRMHTTDVLVTGSMETSGDIETLGKVVTPRIDVQDIHNTGNGNREVYISNNTAGILNDFRVGMNATVDTLAVDMSEQKVGINYDLSDLPSLGASFNVSGSTSFGQLSTDTHQFAGEVTAPNLYKRAASLSSTQHKANYIASEDYVTWYPSYGIPALSDPMMTNTFYLADIRWEISSSNSNAYLLFNNDYAGTAITIPAGNTTPVSVNFTSSNQVYGTSTKGITYPQGFFIATFLGSTGGIEDASQFDVTLHYSGGLTQTIPTSDMEMIAANTYGQENCWKINLTSSQNYLNKVELSLTANAGSDCYFTEFEYFQFRPKSQTGWDFSGFSKYQDQTLYKRIGFNNSSNEEKASIDEDGNIVAYRYKADNGTHPGTPISGAFMYAVSGDMWVKNASGIQTQISPHDENDEWQYFSKNTKTGKVVRIRMEKMIRKLEELTGETFIEEE